MTLQSAAQSAAEAGLRVFPLRARSKEPRMEGGFKSASADPRYVAGLWSQWPDANIGLDLPPGVVVIDVDSDEGAQRVRELALPPAATVVRTGRGWQAYYRLPPGRTLRQGPVDGIGDLKVAGVGYTLLPPSIHPNGTTYSFVRGGIEAIISAAELRDEHVDALERMRGTTTGGNAPVLPETIPAGQRNQVLTSLAGSMRRRGSSPDAIRAALEIENATRCQPPLAPAEIEKIAASVGRYEPGVRSPSFGENTAAAPARRVVARPASQVHREAVQFLPEPPGRVPIGSVTGLVGVPGLGKSTLTCLLAAQNPGVTLIATAEDSPETTVRPRLEAVRADLDLVRFVLVRTDDDLEDGISIPDDVLQLEEIVAETAATLVVIDPLVAHLPGHVDSYKDQSVRRALAPLYRMAKRQNCAVVALIHLNKAQGLAPLARISGSGAFGAAARSVLLLDRDPDDEEGGSRRILAHIKHNVGPEMPSLLYEIEPIVLDEREGEPRIETSRLRLIGESQHSGREILAAARGESRSALEDAVEFLRAELGDGERHPAGDLMREARSLGHSSGTIHAARKKLGVETEKVGFGGGWEWWLAKIQSGFEPSGIESSEKPFADAGLRPLSDTEGSASTTLNLRGRGQPAECRKHGSTTITKIDFGVTFLACGCVT